MNTATHFTITDTETGETLATLPLTFGIAQTQDAFERAGHKTHWTWARPDITGTEASR
jgi:hypothetical protein